MIGMALRIILLTADYVHMLLVGTHFIRSDREGFPNTFKLEVFIKTPETLFEFPLLAIGLDWLELAIVLKSTSALTSESYLQTHTRLKRVFFGVSIVVISLVAFDIIACLFDPRSLTPDFDSH